MQARDVFIAKDILKFCFSIKYVSMQLFSIFLQLQITSIRVENPIFCHFGMELNDTNIVEYCNRRGRNLDQHADEKVKERLKHAPSC